MTLINDPPFFLHRTVYPFCFVLLLSKYRINIIPFAITPKRPKYDVLSLIKSSQNIPNDIAITNKIAAIRKIIYPFSNLNLLMGCSFNSVLPPTLILLMHRILHLSGHQPNIQYQARQQLFQLLQHHSLLLVNRMFGSPFFHHI